MGFLASWTLQLKRTEVRGKRGIPEPISILHLSDLHGEFGRRLSPLKELTDGLRPDLIFLTGDILDEHTSSMDGVLRFLASLPRAPGFFVPGNHDRSCALYPSLLSALGDSGIQCLANKSLVVRIRQTLADAEVRVIGLDDLYRGKPDFSLLAGCGSAGLPSILAAHSPTIGRRNAKRTGTSSLLELAARSGIDLALCGHTHGGQVRLPFLGALYVPGQGFFPRLVHGLYRSRDASMYITSGLGTSHIPLRFLCPPEAAFLVWYP